MNSEDEENSRRDTLFESSRWKRYITQFSVFSGSSALSFGWRGFTGNSGGASVLLMMSLKKLAISSGDIAESDLSNNSSRRRLFFAMIRFLNSYFFDVRVASSTCLSSNSYSFPTGNFTYEMKKTKQDDNLIRKGQNVNLKGQFGTLLIYRLLHLIQG